VMRSAAKVTGLPCFFSSFARRASNAACNAAGGWFCRKSAK
jgi:hypothetical protein